MSRPTQTVSFEDVFEQSERTGSATEVSFEDYFEQVEQTRVPSEVSFEDYFEDLEHTRLSEVGLPVETIDARRVGGASIRATGIKEGLAAEGEEYDFPTGVTVVRASHGESAPKRTKPDQIRLDNTDGVTQVMPLEVPAVKLPERVGALYDEVIDGHSTVYPPSVHECSGPESVGLLERLLPEEFVYKLRRVSERYENGHMYRRIKSAGSEKKKSNHPHYYYLDKTQPGVTRVYFVDPEHKIADKTHKENAIYKRVSVANLVAIEVPDNEAESPMVTVLRYRIPLEHEDPRFIASGNASPDVQVSAAREMLDTRGLPPSILSGDMHKEIKYSIAARKGHSRVQAVQSNNNQMRLFARGQTGSRALEHKVTMQLEVLNAIIEMLSDPNHERVRTVS